MKKLYLSAPLPFVGQKRNFARAFIETLKHFDDATTFVDLFGGSGLLSHITKHCRPDATVVYNDFDDYRRRIEEIPQTNALLAQIRALASGVKRHQRITGDIRESIFECIAAAEKSGYVDYITLSSSLMFSMKYKLSLEEMRKEALYNNVRTTDYPLCPDYLEGLIVTQSDYKELFARYKDVPGVVFLVDPPYLATEVDTYNMRWTLSDYLDVLTILQERPFIYFTSEKSSVVELCEWIGKNKTIGDPFADCVKKTICSHMGASLKYTDVMLYTNKSVNTVKKAG